MVHTLAASTALVTIVEAVQLQQVALQLKLWLVFVLVHRQTAQELDHTSASGVKSGVAIQH